MRVRTYGSLLKSSFIVSRSSMWVEGGFGVNKDLSTNMESKSIISKRIGVDHVRSVSKVINVRMDEEPLRYVRVARRRYELYLE